MVCKNIEDIEYFIYWLVLSDDGNPSKFRDLEFAKIITESLQTLRRVKLAIILRFWVWDPLVGICDVLEEVLGRNKLECIEINLKMRYEYMDYYRWHKLEEVLIKSGWPELKCVSIVITFEFQYSEPPTDLPLLIGSLHHAHFPRLRTSKHLDFKFSVEYIT